MAVLDLEFSFHRWIYSAEKDRVRLLARHLFVLFSLFFSFSHFSRDLSPLVRDLEYWFQFEVRRFATTRTTHRRIAAKNRINFDEISGSVEQICLLLSSFSSSYQIQVLHVSLCFLLFRLFVNTFTAFVVDSNDAI